MYNAYIFKHKIVTIIRKYSFVSWNVEFVFLYKVAMFMVTIKESIAV